MNVQDLINVVFASAAGVMGWFARELWTAVKELKADLAKLREELPRSYITRDDYKDDIREIKAMLTKLFDRLDHKVDK
jgi:hypothetical protein